MVTRSNGTRTNDHRTNGHRTDVVAPFLPQHEKQKVRALNIEQILHHASI